MAWPTGTDYLTAVQNPSVTFCDPDLTCCRVRTNRQGLPLAYSGGFATVFRLLDHNEWAVRCFRAEVNSLTQRYAAIEQLISTSADQGLVPTEHLVKGVKVGSSWYPIVKMQWVSGSTLDTYVRDHAQDSTLIERLADRFRELTRRLQHLGVAHGDLQHGNILVAKDELILVDYDGMYLPETASLGATTMGHINYQHPQRDGTCYGPNLDRFSSLVIYLALRAIAILPNLFNRYDDADSLLFHRSDFVCPDESDVLTQLAGVPALRELASKFAAVCHTDIGRVPSLEEYIADWAPAPRTVSVSTAWQPARRQYALLDGRDPRSWERHVGQRVEVVGLVGGVHEGFTRHSDPYWFLNVGRYPAHTFTFVFWRPSVQAMWASRLDSSSFVGRWVSVIGVVSVYNGRPQVEIETPSQMRTISELEARALLTVEWKSTAFGHSGNPRTGTQTYEPLHSLRTNVSTNQRVSAMSSTTHPPDQLSQQQAKALTKLYGKPKAPALSASARLPSPSTKQPAPVAQPQQNNPPTEEASEGAATLGCLVGIVLAALVWKLLPELGMVGAVCAAVAGCFVVTSLASALRRKP